MTWRAVLFDFEGTLAEIPAPGQAGARPYHDGRRGVLPARHPDGHAVLDSLFAASEAGVPVAIVGAGPVQGIVRWLEEQGVARPKVVMGYHDSVLHRPAPDPWLSALTRLGMGPGRDVLVVGDSADDIVSSVRAGLTPATARPTAPLNAPPALFLGSPEALLEPGLAYALAGGGERGLAQVTLGADFAGQRIRVAGRLADSETSTMLLQGAEGNWSARAASLAHSLIIHAQDGRPDGALLTWLPGFLHGADPLRSLVERLGTLTSLESRSLLTLDDSGALRCADGITLGGQRVLVLAALRGTGRGLAQAAQSLSEAGAGEVVGLALAQEEAPGPSPMAAWGPQRLANDELRRKRSAQSSHQSRSGSG